MWQQSKTLVDLIDSNPVGAALTLVKPAKEGDTRRVNTYVDEVAKVFECISARQMVDRRLRKVEHSSRLAVKEQVEKLRQKYEGLLDSPHASDLAVTLPEVSLEPLRWRDKQGFPRLMVFSIDDPVSQFEVRFKTGKFSLGPVTWSAKPALPYLVAASYLDVAGAMMKQAGFKPDAWYELTLTAEFEGIIPDQARARLDAFQNCFSDIHVIAEVRNWKLGQQVTPWIDADPLIVGWDPKEKTYRLIAAFDVTTVEAAARDYLNRS